MSENKKQSVTLCYHCGSPCPELSIRVQEKSFCCDGCKMVYNILQENDMCTYYDLNSQPGKNRQENIRTDKFAFLDLPEVAQKIIRFTDGKQTQVTFYLPQMHCSSCLWLLENISRIHKPILSSRVHFLNKEVHIVYDAKETGLREVVETLASIGYEPHLSLHEMGQLKGQPENKDMIYKIGIAGFCFSNIMMLSFPEYLGLNIESERHISKTMQYVSLALSLPVLFYCASPFFKSAWSGLKNKFLNIDTPVVVAIIITFLRSLYEIFVVDGGGYLDSMSGIVFFMLVGRWLQNRTHAALSFDRDFTSFFPIAVHTLKEGVFIPLPVEKLKVHDVIKIHDHELIPVDGILSKGKAAIDYSFVSGESMPINVEPGELVYAGGKQTGGSIELLVAKEVAQSYLVSLWNNRIFKETKTSTPSFIHFISNYFTLIVFSIGAVAAGWWLYMGRTDLMWNALTTILIVACPCALLLTANFTFGNVLRILAANQLYFRNSSVLEGLAAINHIVFDKTGTITRQNDVKVRYEGKNMDDEQLDRFASVLYHSSHPAALAVFKHLNRKEIHTVLHFKETAGMGIEAWLDERHIKLGSAAFLEQLIHNDGTVVMAMEDGELIGSWFISGKYRAGVDVMISQLKADCDLTLLSGDNEREKQSVIQIFGSNSDIRFHQKPEDKLNYIQELQQQKHKNVLMVGDGLNDAGALKQSNIGIAVSENSNVFTPASDAILDASQLHKLHLFIGYAKAARKILILTFVFSIVYNIIGLYFAVQGILSPVIAAILMPSSSITIILLTWGLSEWAAKWYELRTDAINS